MRFVLPILLFFSAAGATFAQEIPLEIAPEIQAMAREMEFVQATRIAGRLLMLDTYDNAIWVEWTEVFAQGRWQRVRPDRQFILYPAHGAMMELLRTLPKGTILRMTVQKGDDGKRTIVALEGT